ncbi:hypothetical protein AB0K14_32785 [Actinosynnema sp. NPDC050801]|uniref:hypothetical protein n=1 Tax=unclassified Actinosynnema TaxID=2637065 RepID=UPI0033CEA295
MNRIRTAVAALAVGVGLTVSGGVAAAAPVEATTSDVGVQCTRQYVVTGNATLRNAPGGAVIAYAITGDKFNVPNPSGVWYLGNLYDQYNNHLGYGYMLASGLAYTGTCF